MAMALASDGEPTRARTWLDRMQTDLAQAELSPGARTSVALHLAVAWLELGERDRARAQLTRVQQLAEPGALSPRERATLEDALADADPS